MTRMFNPPHPGVLLRDSIDALGISAREFAQNIGVATSTITRVLKAQSPVTPMLAIKFHAALGGLKPQSWLKLQANYDLWQLQHKVDVSAIKQYEDKEVADFMTIKQN